MRSPDALLRAASLALLKLDHARAVDLLTRALDVLPDADPRAIEALTLLGEAYWRVPDAGRAREAFFEAARRADAEGSSGLFGKAALGYAGPASVGTLHDEASLRLLEQALDRIGPDDRDLYVSLLARMSVLLHHSGDELRGLTTGKRACDIARDSNDDVLLARTLLATAWVTSGPDRIDEAQARAEEIVSLVERAGARELYPDAYRNLASVYFNAARLQEAGVAIDNQERSARRNNDRFLLALAIARRGTLMLTRGDFTGAERQLEAAKDASSGMGIEQALFPIMFVPLRLEQGRIAEVTEDLERAVHSMEDASWRPLLAWVYAEAGRSAEARDLLTRLVADDLAPLQRDFSWLSAVAGLANTARALGEIDTVSTIYARLAPYAGRACVSNGTCWLGLVSRHLGALAAQLERFDDAVSHFEQARTQAHAIGAELEEGWILYETSRGLSRSADASHRKHAVRAAGSALDLARRLRAEMLTQRLLDAYGHAPARGGWARLTRAEVEVSRLVAEGLSNAEIAEALFVARSTVESHLKSVFSKLGIDSRAALAAEFARRQVQKNP